MICAHKKTIVEQESWKTTNLAKQNQGILASKNNSLHSDLIFWNEIRTQQIKKLPLVGKMLYCSPGYYPEWDPRILTCFVSNVLSCIFIIPASVMALVIFFSTGRLLALSLEIFLIHTKFRILNELI